jgi:hypothetical protein
MKNKCKKIFVCTCYEDGRCNHFEPNDRQKYMCKHVIYVTTYTCTNPEAIKEAERKASK